MQPPPLTPRPAAAWTGWWAHAALTLDAGAQTGGPIHTLQRLSTVGGLSRSTVAHHCRVHWSTPPPLHCRTACVLAGRRWVVVGVTWTPRGSGWPRQQRDDHVRRSVHPDSSGVASSDLGTTRCAWAQCDLQQGHTKEEVESARLPCPLAHLQCTDGVTAASVAVQ